MKKFYSLSLVILLFLAGHARVTESGRTGVPAAEARTFNGMDDVINALRTGNASELAKYVDDNIEISLPSKSDSYSRSQAVVILQDFFSTNGVKNFEVKFKGENGGSQYCIGTLQT